MNTFNSHGKSSDYKPIVKLNDGRYLVSFNKIELLYDETTVKNSKVVNTGKKLPSGKCIFTSFISNTNNPNKIVEDINNFINEKTSYNIINSFYWNGYNVYLSKENQMNYKNAFDLAVATNGESLPITLKFKKDGKVAYYTFDSVVELKDFYLSLNKHINTCLSKGWALKDKVNVNDYKI